MNINFNTQNVTNMRYMFYGCSSLTNIDLSDLIFINIRYVVCLSETCYGNKDEFYWLY